MRTNKGETEQSKIRFGKEENGYDGESQSYLLALSNRIILIIPTKRVSVIEWLSIHSYNIYLYHIPFIILLMICRSDRLKIMPSLLANEWFTFAVLLFGGVGSTIVLDFVKKQMRKRKAALE